MAAVPNFGDLANQQYNANADATRLSTWANRPDQTSAMGTIQWNQDPSGRWINNTSLTGGAQNLFDQSLGWQTALGSKVGAGAPEASFGAQQNVIDAWNALQRPGLDKANEAARARAAAMGITLGSNAMNDVERTIGTNEATSRNQGILQGVDAYNKLYQNQLAGFNANKDAMSSFTGVRDSLNPNKWASEVKAATPTTARNIYGSAIDTFSAQRDIENAAQAQSNANRSANMGLLNTGLGVANQIGWGNIGSGISSLWNWGKDAYNNWTAPSVAGNMNYNGGGGEVYDALGFPVNQ